jgi:hypothetical protein
MLANFSTEEIELPKGTVLGVAEEVANSVVAVINDRRAPNSSNRKEARRAVYTTEQQGKFQSYLDSVLGHLTKKERAAMEPILRRFRHVFHDEAKSKFEGTDLVEHRIITGDAAPIRKAPYRVPFALREEIERQVQDMLKKGSLNQAPPHVQRPAFWSQKRAPMALRSSAFVWTSGLSTK